MDWPMGVHNGLHNWAMMLQDAAGKQASWYAVLKLQVERCGDDEWAVRYGEINAFGATPEKAIWEFEVIMQTGKPTAPPKQSEDT